MSYKQISYAKPDPPSQNTAIVSHPCHTSVKLGQNEVTQLSPSQMLPFFSENRGHCL